MSSANRQTILSDSSMVIVDIGKTASPWARETTYLLDSIGRTTETLGNTAPPSFESNPTNTVTPNLTQLLSGSLVLTEVSKSTGTVTSVVGTTSRTDTAFTTTAASPAPTPSFIVPSSTSSSVIPTAPSSQPVQGPSSPPVTMIAMGVSGGALALIVIGVAYFFYRRHRRRKTTSLDSSSYSGSSSDVLEKGEKGGLWEQAVSEQSGVAKAPRHDSGVRDITRFLRTRRANGDDRDADIYRFPAREDKMDVSLSARAGNVGLSSQRDRSLDDPPSDSSLASDEDEVGLPIPFLRKAASNVEEAHRQAILLHEELSILPPQPFTGVDVILPPQPSDSSTSSESKLFNNQAPSTAPSTQSASGSQSGQTHSSSPSTLATTLSLSLSPPRRPRPILKQPLESLRAIPDPMAAGREMLGSVGNLFKKAAGAKYVPTFAEIKERPEGARTNVRFGENQIKEVAYSVFDGDSSIADGDHFEL